MPPHEAALFSRSPPVWIWWNMPSGQLLKDYGIAWYCPVLPLSTALTADLSPLLKGARGTELVGGRWGVRAPSLSLSLFLAAHASREASLLAFCAALETLQISLSETVLLLACTLPLHKPIQTYPLKHHTARNADISILDIFARCSPVYWQYLSWDETSCEGMKWVM